MLLRALIVGAEGGSRRSAARAAGLVDSLVSEVATTEEMRQTLSAKPFDLVFLSRPSIAGFSTTLIEEIRSVPESPEVIVFTDQATGGEEAELLAAGCLAVVPGPLDDQAFLEVVTAFAERRRGETEGRLRAVPGADARLGDYAVTSPSMQRFLAQARRVAAKDSTLLILGETGVGKGLLARSIHNESARARGPFVPVNCGGLAESLVESELFGHEKGAFTGASRTRRGQFELAHGGTIFLDEIGDLPLHLQVNLLQVLEEKEVRPVGSERSIEIDVRIMAATNRDLAQEVAAGIFRRDLYYRLNVVSLIVPPLRERREDIPELVQSYINHFRTNLHSSVIGATGAAVELLARYDWPGNVRELINAIERAAILCEEAEIDVPDLPLDIQGAVVADGLETAQLDPSEMLPRIRSEWLEKPWSEVRSRVLEETERTYLTGILERCGGRIGEAAERAGIDPRSLYEKMRRHGLRKDDFKSSPRRR
jgi:DNA-binding NtrC family response regulator